MFLYIFTLSVCAHIFSSKLKESFDLDPCQTESKTILNHETEITTNNYSYTSYKITDNNISVISGSHQGDSGKLVELAELRFQQVTPMLHATKIKYKKFPPKKKKRKKWIQNRIQLRRSVKKLKPLQYRNTDHDFG